MLVKPGIVFLLLFTFQLQTFAGAADLPESLRAELGKLWNESRILEFEAAYSDWDAVSAKNLYSLTERAAKIANEQGISLQSAFQRVYESGTPRVSSSCVVPNLGRFLHR